MAFNLYWLLAMLLLTSHVCGMEAMMTECTRAPRFVPLLTEDDQPEVHIVYMGGVSVGGASEMTGTNREDMHVGMLALALGSVQEAHDSILYSYTKSFNGFAAIFSRNHAEKIRGMEGVVSVFKQQIRQLHTTASWEGFLGLDPTQGIWSQTEFGNGTIIGFFDTGIWPELASFNDEGFGPIPSKWKGSCQKGDQFGPENCNKKLIGAKYFYKGTGTILPPEFRSARDSIGHGTHTSSTAAGRRVPNASFEGLANGTATGGASSARLAMYKVCWFDQCADADILAGYEEAIADGVDILSLSLGGNSMDYQIDSISIGAFHAVEKGISVSCSAGNSGNSTGTVANTAPWIFTVAASSIDRVYESDVQLTSAGGKKIVKGIAINTHDMNSPYPVVYGGDIGHPFCFYVDPKKVEGKIVVCRGQGNQSLVFEKGAKGFISITDEDQSVQWYQTNVSNTNVDACAGEEILQWIHTTNDPKAIIHKTIAVYNTTPAPVIPYFSSVGPNTITRDMLKPDISAPGVDILAAWAPVAYADKTGDSPYPIWKILSGTSMAAPHTAGAIALVKSAHPEWSPAAIKSAIMTTATPFNTSIPGNYELASGAGEINPNKAANPGLIFDMNTTDYINFLCAIGYNATSVNLMSGGREKCPNNPPTVLDMNVPSIYISSDLTVGHVYDIVRTVTNVGPACSEYSVSVKAPIGTNVQVTPSTLQFKDVKEHQSFTVSVTMKSSIRGYNFGSITWNENNKDHSVRMVIGAGYHF